MWNGGSLLAFDGSGNVTITGRTIFNNIQSGTGGGAAIRARVANNCIFTINDSAVFELCTTSPTGGGGGALFIIMSQTATLSVIDTTFRQCAVSTSGINLAGR